MCVIYNEVHAAQRRTTCAIFFFTSVFASHIGRSTFENGAKRFCPSSCATPVMRPSFPTFRRLSAAPDCKCPSPIAPAVTTDGTRSSSLSSASRSIVDASHRQRPVRTTWCPDIQRALEATEVGANSIARRMESVSGAREQESKPSRRRGTTSATHNSKSAPRHNLFFWI